MQELQSLVPCLAGAFHGLLLGGAEGRAARRDLLARLPALELPRLAVPAVANSHVARLSSLVCLSLIASIIAARRAIPTNIPLL
jgi:hypothetical protein